MTRTALECTDERRAHAHPRRRPRYAIVPAHPHAVEAGGAARRQVPAHRHPDQQLSACRTQADLRADAVQLRVAQPARRPDLPARRVLGRVRRGARRGTDAREQRLVPGNSRRGAPGGAPLRRLRRRVLPDPRRRSSLPDGLLRDDRGAHREPRRHHHRGAAGDAARMRPRWASSASTNGGQIVGFEEKPDDARLAAIGQQHPARVDRPAASPPTSRSWPRWGSTCSRARSCSRSSSSRAWTSAGRSFRRRSAITRSTRTSSAATGRTSARSRRSTTRTSSSRAAARRSISFTRAGRSTRTRDSCPGRGRTRAGSMRRSSPKAATSITARSRNRWSASAPTSNTGARITPVGAARRGFLRGGSRRHVPLGIGRDVVLDRVIVDKNARIADGVRLVNDAGVDDADGDGYYIRNGIIIVPKGAVVRVRRHGVKRSRRRLGSVPPLITRPATRPRRRHAVSSPVPRWSASCVPRFIPELSRAFHRPRNSKPRTDCAV